MLRIFFRYNRRLLGSLCRYALRSVACYFNALTGSELMPGIIAVIQTFGDRINLHPHLHFLVTEGGVDEAGLFHRVPRIDDSRLASLFAREVLTDLVRIINHLKLTFVTERPQPPHIVYQEYLMAAEASSEYFP